MNERVNFQDLIALLAEEKKIAKKDAEIFLRELFSLVSEAVLNDENVKIKDFGTFKVIKINPRESINVQTGDRLTIPAHKKVSFTPDKKISELVNAPFAHLEIIELEDQISETPSVGKEEAKETKATEDKATVETAADTAHNINFEPETPPLPPVRRHNKESKPDARIITRYPILSVFVILFILGIAAWGVYSFIIRSDKAEYLHTLKSVEKRNTAQTPTPKDTIVAFGADKETTETEINSDTLKTKEAAEKEIRQEKTVTIARGERLTLISLREYGEKIFWVYLYQANKDVIDDPNNVSPGTVIRIPAPETYGIDKDSRESMLKAATLAQEIYNSKLK